MLYYRHTILAFDEPLDLEDALLALSIDGVSQDTDRGVTLFSEMSQYRVGDSVQLGIPPVGGGVTVHMRLSSGKVIDFALREGQKSVLFRSVLEWTSHDPNGVSTLGDLAKTLLALSPTL